MAFHDANSFGLIYPTRAKKANGARLHFRGTLSLDGRRKEPLEGPQTLEQPSRGRTLATALNDALALISRCVRSITTRWPGLISVHH
ncbi:MAG: hypothetical protein KGK16_04720 [Bradyrhizobium sp.]|nr:hypothetical protein [Bradyrhizobium sp.]